MIQLNMANGLDCAIYMTTTPGWAAHQTKTTVIKEPALAQLLKLVILIEAVMENFQNICSWEIKWINTGTIQ